MNWTTERTDRLKVLHAEKLSGGLMADALSQEFRAPITRNAVIGKVLRLKLGPVGHGKYPTIRNPPRKYGERESQKASAMRPPAIRYGAILRQPKVRYEAPPVVDSDIPANQRKTLLELTAETCRWPVGDPGSPGFFFCGAASEFDRPYCGAHCAKAYDNTYRRPINAYKLMRVA